MTSTRIKYSGLYGVMPSGYTENVIAQDRPHREGIYQEIFETDMLYASVTDDHLQRRMVQVLAYDKYMISFMATESNNIHLMRYAENITLQNGEKFYHAVMLDISIENISETSFQKVTFEFYDKNPDNYTSQYPVIEYLKSDTLIDRYEFSQLSGVRITDKATGDKLLDLHTTLKPIEQAHQPDESEIKAQNGITVVTNSVVKTFLEFKIYCSQSDMTKAMQLLPLCDGVKYDLMMADGLRVAQVLERPEWDVEQIQGGYDLWKITIKGVYTLVNNYSYGNS